MRPSHSFAFAGLASVMLSACSWEDIVKIFVGIGSLPKVCPSSVQLDTSLMPQLIKFRPFVENRGVENNTTPFTVYLQVTRTRNGQTVVIRNLVFSGANMTIPGTGGVSGVTAGPEVELTTTTNLTSRTISYDPEATYGVTLDFKSSNDGLNIASEDCKHLGPVNFKGGHPL